MTLPTSKTKNVRHGFTLVELLIVVGLIGFMSSMIMYALLGAQTDARVSKTRSTIQKLNEIILQQWEEYRYRPVDMRKASFVPGNAALPTPLPRTQTHLRTVILRDSMRMEMPDRAGDLLFEPSQYVVPMNMPSGAFTQAGSYLSIRAYPHKFGALYSALYSALVNSSDPKVVAAKASYPLIAPGSFATAGGVAISSSATQVPAPLFSNGIAGIAVWEEIIQSSELLYLIVSTSNFAGSPALEMFRPSEIGDPDADGLLEFIDAWGQPIRWIRWPAGYPSDLNRYANTDAMDPLRTDWRFADNTWPEQHKPQTIVPLIVSGGADEVFGETFNFTNGSGQVVPLVYALMRQGTGLGQFYVDPFFTWDFTNNGPNGANSTQPYDSSNIAGYRANQLGSIATTNQTFAADDITNHDLILEP